jgi:hypothetical protein
MGSSTSNFSVYKPALEETEALLARTEAAAM